MSGWSNMPDVISQSNKETTSKSQSKNARSGSSGRRSSTHGEPNTAAAAVVVVSVCVYVRGEGGQKTKQRH